MPAGNYGSLATDGKRLYLTSTEAPAGSKTLLRTVAIDNKRTPNVDTHYAETCIRCHTTGYYPAPFTGAGGFADVEAKLTDAQLRHTVKSVLSGSGYEDGGTSVAVDGSGYVIAAGYFAQQVDFGMSVLLNATFYGGYHPFVVKYVP